MIYSMFTWKAKTELCLHPTGEFVSSEYLPEYTFRKREKVSASIDGIGVIESIAQVFDEENNQVVFTLQLRGSFFLRTNSASANPFPDVPELNELFDKTEKITLKAEPDDEDEGPPRELVYFGKELNVLLHGVRRTRTLSFPAFDLGDDAPFSDRAKSSVRSTIHAGFDPNMIPAQS
mmetsp:Transcript_20204/g.45746  ORF Transcript_20204/g.45746 Transcript_20204/m.45746 type:complete len:177 (+) Transcript_20204:255-785(+)